MELIAHSAPDAPRAVGNYAQALEVRGASRFVFVSGQIPMRLDGTLAPDFEGQARQVWAHVLAQLGEAGMGVANIVRVTTYLADRSHARQNREIRQLVLGEHAPALTVIIAEIFDPAWLLEIEVVAAG